MGVQDDGLQALGAEDQADVVSVEAFDDGRVVPRALRHSVRVLGCSKLLLSRRRKYQRRVRRSHLDVVVVEVDGLQPLGDVVQVAWRKLGALQ